MFQLASEYARVRGLPRIFLAANCGARIGLADEVGSAVRLLVLLSSSCRRRFESRQCI
jgi:hypothetical protein